MKKKKVCIVIPFHKFSLSDYELLCLKTIQSNFKDERKYLVSFSENNLKIKGIKRINFDKKYFKNFDGYNLLCSSLIFYKKFAELNFDYILICQLDVLVLKNRLDYFLKKNLSYIGALSAKKSPLDRSRKKLWARRFFCNGGFSLRKIIDFIDVLESDEIKFPVNYLTTYECLKSGFFKYFLLYFKTLMSKDRNKGEYFAKNFYLKEDTFWTYFAGLFLKNYKLPSIQEANDFCFDGEPNFFFKKNKNKLPMALHGPFDYLNFLDDRNFKLNKL